MSMADSPSTFTASRDAGALSPAAADPSALLRGRDILCFSHDWSGDPLSKTHVMRLLARDNRVLWVNSIGYRTPTVSKADASRAFKKLAAATRPLGNPEPNIYVLNPLAVPVYNRASARALPRAPSPHPSPTSSSPPAAGPWLICAM